MRPKPCRRVAEAEAVKAGVIGAAEWLRLDDTRMIRNSEAPPVGTALAASTERLIVIGQTTVVGVEAATLLLQQMQIATAELAPQIAIANQQAAARKSEQAEHGTAPAMNVRVVAERS